MVKDIKVQMFPCGLRGQCKLMETKVSNPIAVGDKVAFEIQEASENTGVITSIYDRKNYIIRRAAQKPGYSHIIAANIDQAMLIATLLYPKTSLGFIDRFLVSAEAYSIPAIIVFNKTDLYDNEALAIYDELSAIYASIDYCTYHISDTNYIGVV